MEPADFAVRIEEVMAEECTRYECVYEDDDEIGRIWNFLLDDSISGYIGVEDNEETLGIRTVSVGIHLKDITDLSREELVNLFSANSDFINASLSIINIPVPSEESEVNDEEEEEEDEEKEEELRELLIIQSRYPFESFEPDDFRNYVDNMIFQYQAILGNDDEDDGGDDDIDDLDDLLDDDLDDGNEE